MKTNPIDPQLRRKGIFYLILPLVVLPVVFAVTWILFPVQAAPTVNEGLNPVLPVAQFQQEKESKAAAYDFMAQKEKKQPKVSPELPLLYNPDDSDDLDNSENSQELEKEGIDLGIPDKFLEKQANPESGMVSDLDAQEKLIHQRLDKIDQLIVGKPEPVILTQSQQSHGNSLPKAQPTVLRSTTEMETSPELLEMQQMLDALETSSKQPDAQLEQLSEIMDKLLVLQNPELVETRTEEKAIVLEARSFPALKKEYVVEENTPKGENGFFGLIDAVGGDGMGEPEQTTFSAVVPRTQELFPGEALEIKLDEPIWVKGKEIPAGTALFGMTSLSSNRLQVKISGIVLGGELLPLDLTVYSLDAMAGIEVNAKSGAGKAMEHGKGELQSLGMMGMGLDWQAQVANSGMELTKGLLKSGAKAKKVMVKAGHPIFLINSSQTR